MVGEKCQLTSHCLLHVVQDQIHQGIVTLQGSDHYIQSAGGQGGGVWPTFSATAELDSNLLIHVL